MVNPAERNAARLEQYQAAHAGWRSAGTPDKLPPEPYGPVWNAIAIDLWLEHAVGL